MDNAIVMQGVNKAFGQKYAVRDLDLVVPAGSLTGFIGPNGAGKTTTIRMIMSIIFPDSGQIGVLGRSSAIESKDRIGYLPEERGVYKKMKVGAFLTFIGKIKGIDSSAVSKTVREWLERVGLPDVSKKKCEELSKGMQQKVQFIAAVMNGPELLILDEVFTGLDPLNRQLMRKLIDEQHQGGRTIVFSTHAMYEAEQLCDRIFMIHKGEKKLDGPLNEVLERYDPRVIAIEPYDPRQVSDVARWMSIPGVASVSASGRTCLLKLRETADAQSVISAVAAVGGLRSIEAKRPNLEDIFIHLAGGDRAVLDGDADLDVDKDSQASTGPAASAVLRGR